VLHLLDTKSCYSF